MEFLCNYVRVFRELGVFIVVHDTHCLELDIDFCCRQRRKRVGWPAVENAPVFHTILGIE